jgi:predicted glycogen debranching enzyme
MREWIVTNGLGGYSSLTYKNTNIRKYHGLLIASLNPPTERWVFVSNLIDKIKISDKIYNLNDYKSSFKFDYFPSFCYNIEGVKINKTYFMEYGKNTAIVKYNIETDRPIQIIHNPILNSRHFYDVTRHRHLTFNLEKIYNKLYIKPSNINKILKIILDDYSFQPLHYWEEFFYEKDRERSEAWIDNNIDIGNIQKNITKSSEYYLVFTIEDDIHNSPSNIYLKEITRKKYLLKQASLPEKFDKLVISSDNFIVNKKDSKSVIAGYHWFGDWGRDTLIALPGLTLVTKRYEDAKQILLNFAKYCNAGLIPNAFMDRDSKAVYNTVDASLWYIDRVYQYLKYTNDQYFLDEIWEILQSIIDAYVKGTDFDIHMDQDYLLSHGPGLTWMDVKIDNYYPTPRSKKAVEIQALWYNALRIMSIFSNILGKDDKYYDLSEKVKNSFNKQYTQQFDVIDTKDLSFRPNQIFLVSLDFTMIDEHLQKKIVNDVKDKLLTIFGLRTLSTDDTRYKGKYLGDYNKDIAYHNGTIWPWLIGPFVKAYLKMEKYTPESRRYAYNNFIKPMVDVFNDKWDGCVNEIFNGDPIYEPEGCITQAWSVAEILRTCVEDIEKKSIEFEDQFRLPEISV